MSVDRISPLFGSSFGALLRRYREAAGLTQEELAERASLSVRGISDLERGLRQTPRRDTVELLADALDLPSHQRALLTSAARPVMRPQFTAGATPNNLPARLTPLLGRETEARQVAELLSHPEVRLLTLTGPGGVGKTRLALAVAQSLLGEYEDGAYLISLAPLRDPALVMPGVVAALELRMNPEQPAFEQALGLLRDRSVLLILDNFEHLLAAAPEVLALLEACPRLNILVTSREPLKLAGEREFSLAPLTASAATRLFVERAQAVRPDFAPTPADEALIATICGRVDRLPLAIELAASWVRVLSVAALSERLGRRLELLNAGRSDAPARQRSLRGAIAWSADLLSPEERRLFERLAIFAGGCTLEAAQVICQAPTGSAGEADADRSGDTLDLLARLVEKHLVSAETSPEGTRFTQLETIREFAQERLEASGEASALARRHAEYYAGEIARLGWVGADLDARDRLLEQDLPNARAALAWALAHEEPRIGLQLATPLGRWWYSRGFFDEGERWLRTFLSLDARAGGRRAPPQLRGAALYALILLALDCHHFDEAEALAREGLALAEEHGDAGRAGNMLAELGHVAEARGDLDAAMRYFEQGLARYEQGGEGAAVGRTLSSLGNLARAQGNYARAQVYLEQALAWTRERHFAFGVASALTSLGHVACEQGDHARAAGLYRESLEMSKTMRNPAALAWLLHGVVVTLAVRGAYEPAARFAGAIAGLRASVGGAETAAWAPFARATEAARQALGDVRYAAAEEVGRALTPEQAIDDALALMPASGSAS